MEQLIMTWDGQKTPDILNELRPGQYVIMPLDDTDLTPEEEEGLLEAIREADAGQTISFAEALAQVRAESEP